MEGVLRLLLISSVAVLACWTAHSQAAEPADADDASVSEITPPSESLDDLATQLSHPASPLVTIANDFEYRRYQGDLPGAGDQTAWRYIFQPTLPIALKNGKNIFLGASIPINADQPLYTEFDEGFPEWAIRQYADVLPKDEEFHPGHDHLDDIRLDLAYGGTSDSGLISRYGIEVSLPTSTDFTSGRDQWLLGPELVLGQLTSWGVVGGTLKHLTDISGDQPYNTNMSSLEVFFAYGLGNGWQIISTPVIEYDWEGAPDNKLLFPLGGGIAKTTRIGSMPLRMELQLFNYLESPQAFGPEWLLTFGFTPAFSF